MNSTTLYLFPGQGSHYLGMGKDLLQSDDRFFRDLLAVASEQLKRDITPYITEELTEGFTLASNLQPLITAVSLGYWNLLKNEGIEPTAVMGHSLGEITALAPAGVVSPELAVEMATFRGEMMDYSANICGGGGMAVVLFSSEEEVAEAITDFGLEESLFIANYNASNQIVISGLYQSIADFQAKFCIDRRARISKIDVSGPWHTPFISPGREKFIDWVSKKEFSNSCKDFIMNGTADFAQPNQDLKMTVADQLIKPVYWSKSLQTAVDSFGKSTTVIEVGPGKILTGLLRANGVKKKFGEIITVNSIDSISTVIDSLQSSL